MKRSLERKKEKLRKEGHLNHPMKPKAALTARLSEAKPNVTKSAVAERSKALAAKCAIVKKRLTKLLGTRSSVVQVYGLLILSIKARC